MEITIYKITSPTERIYVGQTKDYKIRISQYKILSCKSQVKLYNSLSKYGFEKHKFEIIEICITKEEADKREAFFIKEFNCIKSGLNIALGGSSSPNFNKPLSQTHKDKIRDSNTGLERTEETKDRMRNRSYGFPGHNKGKKFSKEWKEKLSIAKINNPTNYWLGKKRKGTLSFKPFICPTNGKTYKTREEAAKELNIHPTSISAVYNGKRNQVKGYTFKLL